MSNNQELNAELDMLELQDRIIRMVLNVEDEDDCDNWTEEDFKSYRAKFTYKIRMCKLMRELLTRF